jgi:two-component system sensor histidine kinase MprB
MSLRWRWALTLGVAAAAISLLVLLASNVLTARELRSQVDTDLQQRLELAIEADLPRPVPPFELRGRRRAPVNLDALYQVLGPDGTAIIESTDPALPITPTALELATSTTTERSLESVTIDDERFRMIVGGVTDRRGSINLGAIQIAVSVDGIDRSIGSLARRSTAMTALLILAAAGSGWVLAGRAVGPLEQLSVEAERIAATEDLTATVDTTRSDEIGRLAVSFSTMIGSLRSSRQQQQRLVADAGHEFRTPLTALRTNLETLQRRRAELTDAQTAELIDAALAESIELSNLATELVDLTSDAASTGEDLSLVGLGTLAESVVRRFASRTSDLITIQGEGGRVMVRVSQLERAISNLLANAIAWNAPGEQIRVLLEGGSLMVVDAGPGIPESDLPLVFERFHRSESARTKPGSGLGLSIVRHIVESHGGSVFAGNAPDGGASVGFTLPPAESPD